MAYYRLQHTMELVVFLASLKFFFVEGGEQFLVGTQTARKIGKRSTVKITLAGATFGVVLFLTLYFFHTLIPTRWLELALSLTLYFFAASMFKEVFENEKEGEEDKEFGEKSYKYGYITIVSLESVENAAALAALTFIDISGAFIGAAISVSAFVALAVISRRIMTRIPLVQLRLISGSLLALTATPLIIYAAGLPAPNWFQWIIPPLR
jgi:uncharacterized membrane protein